MATEIETQIRDIKRATLKAGLILSAMPVAIAFALIFAWLMR